MRFLPCFFYMYMYMYVLWMHVVRYGWLLYKLKLEGFLNSAYVQKRYPVTLRTEFPPCTVYVWGECKKHTCSNPYTCIYIVHIIHVHIHSTTVLHVCDIQCTCTIYMYIVHVRYTHVPHKFHVNFIAYGEFRVNFIAYGKFRVNFIAYLSCISCIHIKN